MASLLRLYKSTDASAPVLSGTAGALTALLDAVLVNGYGSQPAAGWTIAFTGTNRRAYKQGAGSNVYFRVRDDAGGTGLAKEAQLRGAEVMSAVDTIVSGPFPTNAQSALTDNSLILRKSASADGVARAWIVAADNKTVMAFFSTGDIAGSYMAAYFGDIFSFVPGDAFTGYIIGRDVENNAGFTNERFPTISNTTQMSWVNASANYYQRGWAGTGGSTPAVKISSSFVSAVTTDTAWVGALNYPNAPDGGLWLSRMLLGDLTTGGTKNVRGWMRGVWMPNHAPANFTDGDTLTGTGPLVGRTFLAVKNVAGTNTNTVVFIETSATVE